MVNTEKKSIIVQCVIVFAVCIWPVFFSKTIFLPSDEFVPISIAAYFAGYDWSGVVEQHTYYSYGYSFILYPLFRFIDDPVHFYQAALVINCIFAALVVVPANSILKSLSAKLHILQGVNGTYIVLCAVFYSATIYRANLALCEMPLILIFWLLAAIYLQIHDGLAKLWMYPAAGALLVYGYMVHQRFLGVMIAGLIAMAFFVLIKKIGIRQVILFLCVFFVFFAVHCYMKPYLQDALWHGSERLSSNDYAGRLNQLSGIFSEDRIINLIRVVIGQFYYLFVTTLSVFVVGIIFLIRRFLNSVKRLKNKDLDNNGFYLFLLVATVLTFAIGVLSLTNPTRADHVVYGRYNEFIVGPIILIGLVLLCRKESYTKKYWIALLALCVVVTICLRLIFGDLINGIFAISTSEGLIPYLKEGHLNVLLGGAIAIAGGIIFIMMCRSNRKWKKNIAIIALSVFFTCVAYFALFQSSIPTGVVLHERYVGITDQIVNIEKDRQVYYTAYPGHDSISRYEWFYSTYQFQASYMQYYMYKDNTVQSIDFENLSSIKQPYYLLCPLNDTAYLDVEYDIVHTIGDIVLLSVVKST